MSDIFRLVLPTPFPVGPVNSYVLKGTPLTLVDPGPSYPPAREALDRGLRELGLTLGDFEAVFITHPHIDHYGLAKVVSEGSGATVIAHVDAAERLAAGLKLQRAGESDTLDGLFTRAGVPAGYAASLFRLWAAADTLADPIKVDQTVADGDTVEGGGVTWRVISTPGHSPGAVCFHDEAGQRLIAGDHLLPGISSNAIMEFASGAGANGRVLVRQKSLVIYIASLRKVEGLDVAEVLPGHGEPFTGHRTLIAGRMRHYESRKRAIAAILGNLGPSPAFRVAAALFPEQTEPMGQFLALSEVIGHLDLLEAEGRVRQADGGGVDVYALVEGR